MLSLVFLLLRKGHNHTTLPALVSDLLCDHTSDSQLNIPLGFHNILPIGDGFFKPHWVVAYQDGCPKCKIWYLSNAAALQGIIISLFWENALWFIRVPFPLLVKPPPKKNWAPAQVHEGCLLFIRMLDYWFDNVCTITWCGCFVHDEVSEQPELHSVSNMMFLVALMNNSQLKDVA